MGLGGWLVVASLLALLVAALAGGGLVDRLVWRDVAAAAGGPGGPHAGESPLRLLLAGLVPPQLHMEAISQRMDEFLPGVVRRSPQKISSLSFFTLSFF